ncbi:hypothetical protein GQ457_10G010130 [Hibiscus cannabinus]
MWPVAPPHSDTCMRRVKLHILDKKLKLFDASNKAQINACIEGLKRCILDKKLKLFVKSEKSANLRRLFGWDPRPVQDWAEMKRIMRKWFVPSHYHRDLFQKLQGLKQRSRSVEDYFKEMEMAMLRVNTKEDREATMAHFLTGLNTEIDNAVELQHYVKIDKMVHMAIKPPVVDIGRGKQPMLQERTKDIQCFKCLGRGHVASHCPNQRTMLLRENGDIEFESEEDELKKLKKKN